jgi:tetratricopeptide (TPR) repeat protein
MPARPGVDLTTLEERDTIPPLGALPRRTVALPVVDPPPGAGVPPSGDAAADDERPTRAMAPVARPSPPPAGATAAGAPAAPQAPPPVESPLPAPAPEGDPDLAEADTPAWERAGRTTDRGPRVDTLPPLPGDAERPALAAALRERSEVERDLLAVAAVVGDRFWFGALRSLLLLESASGDAEEWTASRVDDALNALLLRLQHTRLVTMRDPSAVPGELEFAFVDPSDRAALLRLLPVGRRERLHRGVAQWLHELPAPARARLVAVRGWHLEEGRRPEAAALAYHEAARGMRAGGELGEAARLLDRAAALLDVDSAQALTDIQLDRADVLTALGWFDDAARATRAALRGARILGDRGRGGRALLLRGVVALWTEGVLAAADRLTRAEELLGADAEGGPAALCAWARGRLALVRSGPDDVRRANDALQAALAPVAELRGDAGVALRLRVLPDLAAARLMAGDGRGAEHLLREARQLCERTDDGVAAVGCERVAGEVDRARGREGTAVDRWQRALARAIELDLRPEGVRLRVRLGEACLARGDRQRAEELLRIALDDAELLGARLLQAEALGGLAQLGGPHATDLLTRATDLARRADAGQQLARLALARAEVAGDRPAERDRARAALREARERLEAAGSRPLLARVLVRLAGLSGGDEGAALRQRAQRLVVDL